MLIVGAGMAGLLAANMLSRHKPTLIESQTTLPNNHSAVLRFRSSIVGDTLGIQFRQVQMIKAALPWKNVVADTLQYSFKNTGSYRSDRSIVSGTISETRFIAPSDLIKQMADQLEPSRLMFKVAFDRDYVSANAHGCIVSTIPMNVLMGLLDYPAKDKVTFSHSPGINIRARIPHCDAYISLMVADPALPFSRLSITGNELIIECVNCLWTSDGFEKELAAKAADLLGIEIDPATVTATASKYAKINPIDEHHRRDFLHWATDKFNIFSLGRFATWRPGLLLDDLVKDVRLIEGWANDRYTMTKNRRR